MMRQSILAVLAVAALGLFGLTRNAAAADNTVIQTDCCPTISSGCCNDSCQKVCRPTVETRNVPKREYSSRCEDFCLPKCSLLGKLFGGSGCCGDGAGHDCEKPRTRKYLVLHVRQQEECVPKCVVESQCCPTAAWPAPAIGMTPAPGAILPAPPAGAAQAGHPMPLVTP